MYWRSYRLLWSCPNLSINLHSYLVKLRREQVVWLSLNMWFPFLEEHQQEGLPEGHLHPEALQRAEEDPHPQCLPTRKCTMTTVIRYGKELHLIQMFSCQSRYLLRWFVKIINFIRRNDFFVEGLWRSIRRSLCSWSICRIELCCWVNLYIYHAFNEKFANWCLHF